MTTLPYLGKKNNQTSFQGPLTHTDTNRHKQTQTYTCRTLLGQGVQGVSKGKTKKCIKNASAFEWS